MDIAFKVASTIIMIGLAIGIVFRHQKKKHMTIMWTCLVADIALLLAIEFSRNAIAQVGESSGILRFHVWVSAIMIVNYLVAVFTGLRLNKRGVGRGLHKTNAIIFVICRTLNYVTSFMI